MRQAYQQQRPAELLAVALTGSASLSNIVQLRRAVGSSSRPGQLRMLRRRQGAETLQQLQLHTKEEGVCVCVCVCVCVAVCVCV
jgi:hypothetical protein